MELKITIFEKDMAYEVDTIEFVSIQDLDNTLSFLLKNNEKNQWEFEVFEKYGQEEHLTYYEYLED